MATSQVSEVSPRRSNPHQAMAAVMSRILLAGAASPAERKRAGEQGGVLETGTQRKRRKTKVNIKRIRVA